MPEHRTPHLQPVLVGGGQSIDRPEDATARREPLALMEEAARRAIDDAGAGRALLDAIDTVAVVKVVFYDYGDAAALLAERLGCRPARTINTTIGGNTPQSLLNLLCDDIAAGRSRAALVTGAEASYTSRLLSKAGRSLDWTPPRELAAPLWGDPRGGMSELEVRHGAARPIDTYPMLENAWRAARGLSLDAHRRELAEFCGRCAAIAAANPYAWFRDGKSADAIATVTPENRMIGFPYPKFMNSIIEVNQGAAVVLTSEETARTLGIARERRVYPWAGVDVTELWYLQDRVDYTSLPGVRRAGAELLETAGVAIGDVAHLDLYSCFPIAPRLSAAMLGIPADDPRPLTVTGGLPWFGGPGNNYTTHAVVTLMERLRRAPETVGLAHALGWNMTKHALALYSGTPPRAGWRRAGGPALQGWVDALPHPPVAEEPAGRATVETYTVAHGRDGAPERGTVIGRLADGHRFLAVTPRDRALLEAMERCEQVGRAGTVRREGQLNVFAPS